MTKKSRGMVKGAPSGFVISLMVHAAAILLAGMLVVFTVHQKEEKKFIPPKAVDRPKMKLKKPKVKVKKTAKPKATTRIVTKVRKASMPDIQLPEMSGLADGLAGSVGGFEIVADMEQLSVLGSMQSIGSDLEGTYYDLKLNRRGGFLSNDQQTYRAAIVDFVRKGWRTATLFRYFRSPNRIYATSLIVPTTRSSIAPSAFGDRDASGAQWMVHYKGQLVHAEGITFRFRAAADETILVRVDGKVVVGAKWANVDTGESNVEPDTVTPFWQTSSMQSYRFIMGNSRAAVGDWITLEPGVPQDMEIVISDNGGAANFYLTVEEKGVEYPKNSQGGPILPAFKTAPITRDMMDLIYKDLPEEELDLVGGPIFNDYSSASTAEVESRNEPVQAEVVEPEVSQEPVVRLWSMKDQRNFEAEFVRVIGGMAAFKTVRNKIVKIPLGELSEADQRFIGLARPPAFDVNFIRDNNQKTFAMESFDENNIRPPEYRNHYGIRVRQTGAGDYPYALSAVIYVVGQERLGDRYILLDKQKTSFTPNEENRRSHEYRSPREVVLQNYFVQDEPRGEKYAGYLVVLTDELDREIGVYTSDDWLYENLDNLQRLGIGHYMNKNCERVFPTRPPAVLH